MTRPTVLPTPELETGYYMDWLTTHWPHILTREYTPIDRDACVMIRIVSSLQGIQWFPTISPPIV